MRCSALLLSAALLGFFPARAAAQGINLLWNDCSRYPGYMNQDFACDSDAGAPFALVPTVHTFAAIDGIVGAEGMIVLEADAAVVPDFWRLDPAGCRAGALVPDPDIGISSPPYTCDAPWAQASTRTATARYYPHTLCGPNWGTILWSAAVPTPVTFGAENEHYLIRLLIARSGSAACPGCSIAGCLVFTKVRLLRPAGDSRGDVTITLPAQNQHVTWQRGGTTTCPSGHGTLDCPVPVRDATWGLIKSMYR